MRIPTSELIPTPDEVPAGLPDVSTLARMANAFFTALPGAAQGAGQVASVASWPLSPEETALSDPAGVLNAPGARAATPGDALPHGARAPQATEVGVTSQNVPDPPKAPAVGATKAVVATASPLPTSPFYFLEYAGSGWDALAGSASKAISLPTAPVAHAQSLPSGFDLGGLRGSAVPVSGSAGGASAPTFYFLESTLPAADVRRLQGIGQHPAFNVAAIRRDFPILSERVNGRSLIWLDNAATTQKPQAVIDRLAHFYSHQNSNIHRAAHELAARATDAYEGARATVQRFLGASSPEEIVFVRGATEAINLVAQSWGRQNILPGDEIVVSHLEHHANIVPWQMLAREKGARLRVIPVDDSGQILLDEYQKLLNSRTRLVSIAHVSNALGTIVPVREVSELAHRAGARVLVDGAQAVSHMPVDVRELSADFYVFSGHKVFGPTGIGVLYGTAEILESMPPWQGGGNMISAVTFERTTYQKPPARFEAGTGNIADAAGLAAALDYVTRLGMANIDRYEHDLLAYATAALQTISGLRLIGTAREKASVLSFVLDGYDPVEVGAALNEEGIAVRAGHHCAEPILNRFGVKATVRPSLAFYNTCEEVDTLAAALRRLIAQQGRR